MSTASFILTSGDARRLPQSLNAFVLRLLGAGLLVAAWQLAAATTTPLLLPGPVPTTRALWALIADGSLVREVSVTLARCLAGVALGSFIGVLLGAAAAISLTLSELLAPLRSALLGAPPIVIVVIAFVWLGGNGLVPVLVVAAMSIPIMLEATAGARTLVSRDLLEMAHVFHTPPRHTARHVVLPALAPALLTGLTLASANGVRVTVMAELLSTTTGVGAAMATSRIQLDSATVFAWALASILLVIAFEALLLRPMRRRARL